MSAECTLVVIKPDAIKRHLVGSIVADLEALDLELMVARTMWMPSRTCDALYREHRGKSYYAELKEFMTSGLILAIALGGENAISTVRCAIGPPNPRLAAPDTIRGRFGTNEKENCIHASDSSRTAEFELNLLFPEGVRHAPEGPRREGPYGSGPNPIQQKDGAL